MSGPREPYDRGVMPVHQLPAARTRRDVRASLLADGAAGLDAEAFLRRAMRALSRVVAFDAGAFATVDTDTLLCTGGVLHGLSPDAMVRFAELELQLGTEGRGDELRVAFARGGRCYGAAYLLRAEGGPGFTEAEARFVAGLAGDVAEGLRAALARSRVGGGERGARSRSPRARRSGASRRGRRRAPRSMRPRRR